MDVLKFVYGLAEALFEAFGGAVKDYRLPTLCVFLIVFAYLHQNSKLVFFDENGFKRTYSLEEILFGLIGFIIAVALSNVVGYMYNAIVALVAWVFGTTKVFVGPFGKHPLQFVSFLLTWAVAALVYASIRFRWRPKNANIFRVFVTCFVILFATYVSTSLYVSIRGEDKDTEANGQTAK